MHMKFVSCLMFGLRQGQNLLACPALVCTHKILLKLGSMHQCDYLHSYPSACHVYV